MKEKWIIKELTLPDLNPFDKMINQDNTTTLLPDSDQQKCDWNYIYQEIR